MSRNNSIDDLLASIDSDDVEEPQASGDSIEQNDLSALADEAKEDSISAVDNPEPGELPETDNPVLQDDSDDVTSDLVESSSADNIEDEITEGSSSVPESTDTYGFKLKGTKQWNTREPYIIRIDSQKLKNEIIKINNSFYFIDEEFAHDNDLKSRINREILKMKSGTIRPIKEEFSHFVYASLSSVTESLKDHFKLSDDTASLFVYHIGPQTLYRNILFIMRNKKTGYCYLLSETPGQVLRFFPEEYLKVVVMNWFEENINPLDLNYDSIQKFDLIRNHVAQFYSKAVQIFDKRYQEINQKLTDGRSVSREELMKLKGEQWFGMSNIYIYKRFIPKTIF
jgi:hypothetical protein